MTSAPPLTAETIIEQLGLETHPMEGGYFREIYRSSEPLRSDQLPSRYGADRSLSTAIYYLLTPSTFSELHRLQSDEIFHFYLGDPVEQLHLLADGRGRIHRLGSDLATGEVPQLVVPRGVWQGSRLAPGGENGFALLGTTVAPGFDYADYERGDRSELAASYPNFAELIEALTH